VAVTQHAGIAKHMKDNNNCAKIPSPAHGLECLDLDDLYFVIINEATEITAK